ncbi:hypothetical protein H2202_010456 [Exophiala xenobiotica]|nr:hypothetical protein H2202_010456 [Exophiala xenobiotica]KAK5188796.1 hypothetical protein LTR92_011195 [Exophiala xenobiotica]KAK5223209.1 hypothetical protein LTR47_010290 [Exophiala xenobiotica]KAK5227954.1 hypothetical protein LTR72_001837 [Exophiala xenobiotica]KAK5245629.1 hypothetical protein LTS06_008994 [Exophiala xenobiotica]
MRAVTIAAAGAAVIGSVSASSHVKNMHAKLHENVARDTWDDWNTTSSTSTTTKKPVDPKTTAITTTTVAWEDWDTTTSSSSTTTTTTTKKPVKPATTSSSAVDPWADWTSTTTTTTTTTPADPWVDWTTTSSSKPVDPATTSSTEVWADWTTSSPVDGESTSTVTETWGDWTTSSPVDPATTTSTETWGDWSAEETTTTVTLESTKTTTKYVKGLTSSSGAWTASTPAAVTSVITSTITPGGGWFGPAWTVAADSCAIEVFTSYGAATWSPTPADPAAASTTSATWADWTSSTPAAAATTTSSSSTSSNATWADWTTTSATTSTTSASPSATTTTSSAAGEWGWPASASASASTTASGAGGSWGWSGSASASASASGTSSSAKPSGGSHGGSPGISANGNSWAMTYSPYTSGGGCKDAGTVATDLAVIAQKGFSSVRIYSTDCSALQNVGTAARNNGLKIILGVWISSTGISGAQGQISDIVSWGGFDLVELIVIGNEAVFNGYCSASELATFISASAGTFKAAGYTGLVTTTEPLSVWEESSAAAAFLSVIDVCGANLYAFFNADVTADKAGSFIQSEIDIMNGICSGKPVYVLESGWPHAGSCNGAACPSPENQATALKGIHSTVGAQVVFLSYEDEPWKAPGQFDVEQFWGCADVF